MKTEKLNLAELDINNFVTTISNEQQKTINTGIMVSIAMWMAIRRKAQETQPESESLYTETRGDGSCPCEGC